MPKYRVYALYTASKFLGEFEANSKEEAVNKGEEKGDTWVSLCHQCSDEIEVNDDPHTYEAEEVEE